MISFYSWDALSRSNQLFLNHLKMKTKKGICVSKNYSEVRFVPICSRHLLDWLHLLQSCIQRRFRGCGARHLKRQKGGKLNKKEWQIGNNAIFTTFEGEGHNKKLLDFRFNHGVKKRIVFGRCLRVLGEGLHRNSLLFCIFCREIYVLNWTDF